MQSSSNSTVNQAIGAIQDLLKKSKPGTSTSMKSAVVGLYTADIQGQLRYSNCIGLLQLDTDRQLKSTVLRLYNLQTLSLMFQIQLYFGFANNYKMVTNTFYTFTYPRGFIGFLFKNKQDAEMMRIKIFSMSPKIEQFQKIQKQRIQAQKLKKKQGGFLGKLKTIFGDQPQPKQQSGKVMTIQKVMAFDLKTGKFNTQNIPPQWQQIFDSLNLTKQDLNNKQIANLIAQQTIIQQVKTQAYIEQDPNLQKKIKQAQQQQKIYIQQCRKTAMNKLPPPPPPPPFLLAPPQMSQNRASFATKRGDLMQEIRNNKLKLNHVSKINNGVNLDISNMNRQQRKDHAERLRQKLKMRKLALNRRQASDQEDN